MKEKKNNKTLEKEEQEEIYISLLLLQLIVHRQKATTTLEQETIHTSSLPSLFSPCHHKLFEGNRNISYLLLNNIFKNIKLQNKTTNK